MKPIPVYAREDYPTEVTKSMFLAGPTPRGKGESWRPEALRILDGFGYDGHVFIPEPRDGVWAKDYLGQVEWEEVGLNRADCIVFWVPRVIGGEQPMPAFTTNDEWGFWKSSGKAVFGAPPNAEKVRYQQHYAKVFDVPLSDTLRGTLRNAVSRLSEGARRAEGHVEVPLYIWQEPAFQSWLTGQYSGGRQLQGCRVLHWSPALFALTVTMARHQPVNAIDDYLNDGLPSAPQTEIVVFRQGIIPVTLES